MWAVLFGVVALLVAYLAPIVRGGGFEDSDVAALGVIASPIVAIVSAYFGIQATQEANKATTKAAEITGEAERKAIDAEMRAETAVNLGATQGRNQLRNQALKKLEELAELSQPGDEKAAKEKAALAWDDIQRDSGLFDEPNEPGQTT